MAAEEKKATEKKKAEGECAMERHLAKQLGEYALQRKTRRKEVEKNEVLIVEKLFEEGQMKKQLYCFVECWEEEKRRMKR